MDAEQVGAETAAGNYLNTVSGAADLYHQTLDAADLLYRQSVDGANADRAAAETRTATAYGTEMDSADAAFTTAALSAAERYDAALEAVADQYPGAIRAAGAVYDSRVEAADAVWTAEETSAAAAYEASVIEADEAFLRGYIAANETRDGTVDAAFTDYRRDVDAATMTAVDDRLAAIDLYAGKMATADARYEAAAEEAADAYRVDLAAAADRFEQTVEPEYEVYEGKVAEAAEALQREIEEAWSDVDWDSDDSYGAAWDREWQAYETAYATEEEAWAVFQDAVYAAESDYWWDLVEAEFRLEDAEREASAEYDFAEGLADRDYHVEIRRIDEAWVRAEKAAGATYEGDVRTAEATHAGTVAELEAAWERTEAAAQAAYDVRMKAADALRTAGHDEAWADYQQDLRTAAEEAGRDAREARIAFLVETSSAAIEWADRETTASAEYRRAMTEAEDDWDDALRKAERDHGKSTADAEAAFAAAVNVVWDTQVAPYLDGDWVAVLDDGGGLVAVVRATAGPYGDSNPELDAFVGVGHHAVPLSELRELFLDGKLTRDAMDYGSGYYLGDQDPPHRGGNGHTEYNKAVRDRFENYRSKHGINGPATQKQLKDFIVTEIENGEDPVIRDFYEKQKDAARKSQDSDFREPSEIPDDEIRERGKKYLPKRKSKWPKLKLTEFDNRYALWGAGGLLSILADETEAGVTVIEVGSRSTHFKSAINHLSEGNKNAAERALMGREAGGTRDGFRDDLIDAGMSGRQIFSYDRKIQALFHDD